MCFQLVMLHEGIGWENTSREAGIHVMIVSYKVFNMLVFDNSMSSKIFLSPTWGCQYWSSFELEDIFIEDKIYYL